jgi:hypothetical protein
MPSQKNSVAMTVIFFSSFFHAIFILMDNGFYLPPSWKEREFLDGKQEINLEWP